MTRTTARLRRLLVAAVAMLALATFALGVRRIAELPRVAREARAMCEGLPDYAALAAALPLSARVLVIVDPAEERAAERFSCARLELAPRRVEGRRSIDTPPDPEGADARIFDFGRGARLEASR